MAIHYKVVKLKGRPDPRSSGETPEVTADSASWNGLAKPLTRRKAPMPASASSQQYSARIAVTLIFKKVMA